VPRIFSAIRDLVAGVLGRHRMRIVQLVLLFSLEAGRAIRGAQFSARNSRRAIRRAQFGAILSDAAQFSPTGAR